MKPIFLSFHIGRGGHFNNPGFLLFSDEEDFQDLLHRCGDDLIYEFEDEEGNALPDADCKVYDTGGNEILRGRDVIESKTGRLDFDGSYNTSYVKEFNDLDEIEFGKVWDHYVAGNLPTLSDELKDALCTSKDLLRAKDIKRIGSTIQIATQKEGDNHTINIDIDQQAGVFTRKEWKEDLEDMDFCPVSVEAILDYMENFCYTNDSDFFAEDEETE